MTLNSRYIYYTQRLFPHRLETLTDDDDLIVCSVGGLKMRWLYIVTALAFVVALLRGADARAAGYSYWNDSGFSISHQFYPGRGSSYFNYAPRYYGFNRYYFDGQPSHRGSAAKVEDTLVPVDWAKKCNSSCLDLSGHH